MNYFILILFAPAIVLAIAAIAFDQPETRGNLLKSAFAFLFAAVLILPIRFWNVIASMLFHHSN